MKDSIFLSYIYIYKHTHIHICIYMYIYTFKFRASILCLIWSIEPNIQIYLVYILPNISIYLFTSFGQIYIFGSIDHRKHKVLVLNLN